MSVIGQIFVPLLHILCAGMALALAGWLVANGRHREPATQPEIAALGLTAIWALGFLACGPSATGTSILLSTANLAWLWMLMRLFAQDGRSRLGPIRSLLVTLMVMELLQTGLLLLVPQYHGQITFQPDILRLGATLQALFCIGGLVLVHNLYVGGSKSAREALRWPAAGLAALWLYDLNTATVAYLGSNEPETLVALRVVAAMGTIVMLAIGSLRKDAGLRFSPSRYVAFRSFSLFIIGAYLMAMFIIAQGLAFAGGELARFMQVGFVAVAAALALLVLPSPRLRGWFRVMLSKHLFQHRYDYRAEWLRFTETMGRAGPGAPPLRERVVQAIADVTDSPGGLLLTPHENGGLALDTRWQWPEIEVSPEAASAAAVRFFEMTRYIADLDDLRAGRVPDVSTAVHVPWLLEEKTAWAMVPLVHYERLVGVVVLARPPLTRRLDWEDFDLLGVLGRQLASYLAEQASQDALGEALRFDEFNRRIAFVMHDIKNLASQLSLLARNSEKHADKPEFRADMILTLRNSTDKLQALLTRLGRYGAQGSEPVRSVPMDEILSRISARFAQQHEVVVIDRTACTVLAEKEGLEQALVHLIQNAIDASDETAPVFLRQWCEGGRSILEIVDSGCGMSAEFVRTRLFKPFHSSKPGGFGIGAFEARELIRAMGGQLDVESREGLGTRFRVALPLDGSARQLFTIKTNDTEVV